MHKARVSYIGAFERLYAPLAGACGLLVAVVWMARRDDGPVEIASAGIAFDALLLLTLHLVFRGGVSRVGIGLQVALHLPLGLGTGALAYFMGPHSGMGAFLAALFVLLGVTSGTSAQARLLGSVAAASVAAGQAVLVGLVVSGAIPDRSLFAIIPGDLQPWQVAVLHLALQAVYVFAFLGGLAFQRRYADVAVRADEATRVAIRRDALLAEARAEHQRALVASVHGAFAGQRMGRYHLGELIARGGMGEVYDAVGEDGGHVAVKVMRGDRLRDPVAIERLRDEVRALACIDDPHVARMFDAGGGSFDLPYIAMERLDGRDLAAMALGDGPLLRAELRLLVEHVAQALGAVHSAGLVHSDVSPRNLLRVTSVDHTPHWKLVDLGGVRATSAENARTPLGTLRYMAPEQIRGAAADIRTDVYGFGLCLYLAATGRTPFFGHTKDGLVAASATAMPVAPSALVEIDAAFEQVLRVAIAKDPGERFANAAELRDAALAALSGQVDEAIRARAEALARALPWADPPSPNGAAGSLPEEETLADTLPTTDLRAGRGPGVSSTEEATEPDSGEPTEATRSLAPPAARKAEPSTDRNVSAHELHAPAEGAALWESVYLGKLATTGRFVLWLAAGGIAFMALMAVKPEPLIVGSVGTGLILLLCARMVLTVPGRTMESARYPERIVMAMLSVAPAYFFGMTSAFVAVMGAYLFNAGIATRWRVHAGQRLPWIEVSILVGTIISHSTCATLIFTGVVPDAGLYPVLVPGAPEWEPILTHVAIQGGYVLAWALAYYTEARYAHELDAADRAAREAARKRALLDTARSELMAALTNVGDGIFTGHQIGDYRLGVLLGRGAMGEVYEAFHTGSGQRAALKLIRGDRLGDEHSLRRFLREAVALSRVESEHVARVFDVGDLDGELPHIAMELLEGDDLATLLRERTGLGRGQLVQLIRDVAVGLEAVHTAGVVHRDIKPTNIVIAAAEVGPPRWKLVDFGVAKIIDRASASTDHYLVGTPAYMAPEQATGAPVDARADLYAFGLVIYRVLVGRPAFTGSDAVEVLEHMRRGVPDPGYYVDLDEGVELALRIASAPNPDDRFESAREMAGAFAAAFDGALPSGLEMRGRALLAEVPWADHNSRSAVG